MSVFHGNDDASVDLNRKKQVQLDFQAVHKLLGRPEGEGDEAARKQLWDSKILLLQALRWRIDRHINGLG